MNFDLLKRLCEAPGIPGREKPIRDIVLAEMRELAGDVTVDIMGSVVGLRRGTGGPRVMLAAHMDEIGFMVRHIDDKGFLRLQPLGGWDPRNLVSQRVWVHIAEGGPLLGALVPSVKPIHMASPEELAKAPKVEELYIDLGLPGDEVKAQVSVGDPVTMARTAELVGRNVMSKTLDDRLGVFVMLEALRSVGTHACDIVAVATTQEEVGLRGATTAAFAADPQVGIAIDVTLANDVPGGSDTERISALGAGTAIKILDGSLICHPPLVRHFRDLAEAHGIAYQMEILPRGGTDAGAVQRTRGGVPAFTLSVPTRYVHTVNEMAAVADIEASIALLARYLEDAHTRDYSLEQA